MTYIISQAQFDDLLSLAVQAGDDPTKVYDELTRSFIVAELFDQRHKSVWTASGERENKHERP